MEMEAGSPSSNRSRSVSPGDDKDRGGVDRISNLPDAILGDIISQLPTKAGARTGLLASRWRHLWRSAPLNLDCRRLVKREDDLAGVLSHILSSHQGPGRRFFILQPHGGDSNGAAILDTWLRSPALDNLQELDVWCCDVRCCQRHLLSASTLRFSTTLRVLTVGGCDLSNSSAVQAIHLPLLKQLGVEHVRISECSLHSMIASCPVLQCLFIAHAVGLRCIMINSPSLKTIGIRGCGMYRSQGMYQSELKELVIESAPSLEMLLDLGCNYDLQTSLVSAPKLETLGFLCQLLRDGKDLSTRLEFGSTVIQGLRVHSLAMAVHTVKTLDIYMDHLNLDIVIELMRCFPCLEKLYIGWYATRGNNLWRGKHRNLDIRLKTIVLKSYRGFRAEVNFATFFVLNAKVLELMVFRVYCKELIAEQHKKLQLDNKVSTRAQFHFTTDKCLLGVSDINHVRDLDFADPHICRF